MGNNDKLMKIVFILPYFGKFKNYFPYFLQSCKNNPTIDWLIFTDCNLSLTIPDNVIIHNVTWESFSTRIKEFFGLKTQLDSPYKLCDFKPAYGEIFQQEIKEYDFWGHCDCDLVFGNIRKFITDDILDKYDRIGNCGHFILYRNNKKLNEYYRTQNHVDFKIIFSDPKSYSFDEWPGISKYWHLDGLLCYDYIHYDDIRTGYDGFRCSKEVWGGYIGPYHSMYNECRRYLKMRYIIYSYNNGTLKRIWLQRKKVYSEEVLYVHLQKRSMSIEDNPPLNNYFIVPNSFVSSTEVSFSNLKILAKVSERDRFSDKKRNTTINMLKKDVRCFGQAGYIGKAAWIGFLKSFKLSK